jgi:hypothetical protein
MYSVSQQTKVYMIPETDADFTESIAPFYIVYIALQGNAVG